MVCLLMLESFHYHYYAYLYSVSERGGVTVCPAKTDVCKRNLKCAHRGLTYNNITRGKSKHLVMNKIHIDDFQLGLFVNFLIFLSKSVASRELLQKFMGEYPVFQLPLAKIITVCDYFCVCMTSQHPFSSLKTAEKHSCCSLYFLSK